MQDEDVAAVVPALQKQVSEHLSAVWGIDATLNFVQQGASPPAGTWWLTILDNSDQAGSLGYHDLTNEGLPLGRVFAGSDMVNGNNWTVTASHELLEMLIDPDINRAVFIQDETGAGKLYAYEICDLCESDQYGYQIDEVLVSDFLFPSWFESFRTPGSAQFDVMQHITQPFELLAGGYINTYDVGAGRGGWQPLNAAATPQNHLARGPVGAGASAAVCGEIIGCAAFFESAGFSGYCGWTVSSPMMLLRRSVNLPRPASDGIKRASGSD